MVNSNASGQIRLVVFDWAGTTVDFGCFAPVAPYREALARHGLEVSDLTVRGPMGLAKRDHLQALLDLPAVAQQWRNHHGRDLTRADGDRMFEQDFIPLQLAAVRNHSRLIPGLLETVAWLRERDIKIATTTGYFQEAAQICAATAAEQGYHPDANLTGADVPAGRPAPWMIFRHMERFKVYPPSAVLKVGDTLPDIGEGLAAGAWSVGVAQTSSDVGLTEEEWHLLPLPQRQSRLTAVRQKLLEAGAHEVIDSVADVPALVERIENRLSLGERP